MTSKMPMPGVLTFGLIAASLWGCGGAALDGSAGASSASSVGGMASDFAARGVDGRTVKLSDYLGKQAVLLDFWATYCQPCLAEMPHLRALYEANKDKGFVVIAVSMDEPQTVADVPSFAKRNGLVFPVVLDEDSHVASIYNPKKSAPLSVLIDKAGHVVHVHEGYNPGDEQLIADAVAKVLR